jgi:light-regulated signal transduction histidine kinase (bacteriophytochrome)
MAGYEVDEFPHLLEEFRKRVHPDDVEKVFSAAEDYFSGKLDQYMIEFRFHKKEGDWLWVMGRGKITEQDENGNPLRFVGTHTDIGAQKSVEEKLNQYQLQLEDIVKDRTQRLNERISEVERLNAALTNILDDYQIANEKLSSLSTSLTDTYQELESFTYSVSNDLRIPLTRVKDSAEILLHKYPDKIDPKALDHIRDLLDNAQLMDTLISDLIKLSLLGRQALYPVPLDPTPLIEGAIKTFADQIKKNKTKIKIKELPHCRADENLLKIVFHNLISNAVKFTQNKKKPEIIIGYQPDQSSERVVYYIKDNGVGFKMEDMEKAFDTFQRLHSQDEFQGTGTGLALAKKIINRHGGEIWVEAAVDQGATFYFDLERS